MSQKEIKYSSIESIASRASINVLITTLAIVVITSVVWFIRERNARYDFVQANMDGFARTVTRSIAAELLIGDSKSVEALKNAMIRDHELSSLEIWETRPELKPETFWTRVLRPTMVERVEILPGLNPPRFVVMTSASENKGPFSKVFWFLMIGIPIGFFGVYSLLKTQKALNRSIVEPIQKLAHDPEHWTADGPWVAEEAVVLHQRLMTYIQERDAERDRVEALKIEASVGQVAAQVAHDIRSPLAALDMVAGILTGIPEQKRVIIRSALGRIRDIANGLLDKHRTQVPGALPSAIEENRADTRAHEPSVLGGELLSSLIDSLVTEKRMQFRTRWGVEIEAPLSTTGYGLFSPVEPTDFKRVLSNLINNAVEAIEERGRVLVELGASDREILVRISDNGKGISAEVLPRLLKRGGTFGKSGGVGLGLADARAKAESWGGRLEIQSSPKHGTVVELYVPRIAAPHWFVEEIDLMPGNHVVVLDDDSSIHQIWQGRFASLRLEERGIQVVHLSSSEALKNWVESHPEIATEALYLVDYELIGSEQNGLDLIKELGIASHSILVTSRFEERAIRLLSQDLKVRLIPKSLAGFVPIQVADSSIPALARRESLPEASRARISP